MKLVTREICGQGIFPEKLWGLTELAQNPPSRAGLGAGGVGMGTMVLARCKYHTNSKFENFEFSRFLDFASKNRGFTIFFLCLGDKITWF